MQNTRKKAIELRESHYFTGKPCKHGHVSNRNTISGDCCECARINQTVKRQELRKLISNQGG